MGLVKSESSAQTSTSNFTHPHPMQFSNLRASGINSYCSICKLPASGPVYICTPCKFIVHPKCYDLTKQIKHESHKIHPLYLRTKPVYPGGIFRCNGCGNEGDGSSYSCSPCGFDLHSACVSLPAQLTHRSHKHKLRLTFCDPNQGNAFICDICKAFGSNIWRYRCSTCDFDAHVTCVKQLKPHFSTFKSRQKQPATPTRSSSQVRTNSTHPPNTGAYGPYGSSAVIPAVGHFDDQPGISTRTQDTLSLLQGLQQITENNNHASQFAITSRTENTMSFLQGLQQITKDNNNASQLKINSRTQETLSYLQGLQQISVGKNNARTQANPRQQHQWGDLGGGFGGNNNMSGFL